jgi:hypothetical protein
VGCLLPHHCIVCPHSAHLSSISCANVCCNSLRVEGEGGGGGAHFGCGSLPTCRASRVPMSAAMAFQSRPCDSRPDKNDASSTSLQPLTASRQSGTGTGRSKGASQGHVDGGPWGGGRCAQHVQAQGCKGIYYFVHACKGFNSLHLVCRSPPHTHTSQFEPLRLVGCVSCCFKCPKRTNHSSCTPHFASRILPCIALLIS